MRRPRAALLVVALQLAALLVLSALAVQRVRVWAVVDEAAHYDVVQSVAEDHRLPRLTDTNHWEVRAIADGSWPRRSGADPRALGLAGVSYEAFQPPLYYLVAAPAFAAGGDHRAKVRTLRWFDVGLLLVAVALLALLARALARDRWLVGVAAGLAVLLWPGVLVRAITVSPTALELTTVTALVAVLWRVLGGGGRRWLVATGAVLAACVLTKNTLVFVVPVAVVVCLLDWRRRRDSTGLLLAAALAVVLVAPWLAFNHAEYGSLTAASQAQDQQRFIVNRDSHDFTAGDALRAVGHLPDDVLPREFRAQLGVWWVHGLAVALCLALVVALVLLLARRGSRRALLLTAAPLVTGVVVLAVTMVASDWPTLTGRYVYAALPALAVGLAAAAPRRWALPGVLVATAFALAIWVDVAGAFYFTGVGDALGIGRGTYLY